MIVCCDCGSDDEGDDDFENKGDDEPRCLKVQDCVLDPSQGDKVPPPMI